MQTIILGTDGSPGALAGAQWCAVLAQAMGAEVVVVHALTTKPELEPAGGVAVGGVDGKTRAQVEGEWTASLRSAGVPTRIVLAHDDPAALLQRTADQLDADIVVMGRRSHPGWTPALLGSVAHKVLHDVARPVAIVPQTYEPGANRPGRIAVVGVDGSAASLAALRFGLEHAEQLGVELRAVYVVDPHAPARDPLEVVYDDEDGVLVGASAALAKLMADEAAGTTVSVAHVALLGDAGDQLTRASTEAGLLIVGNVQRGTLGELLHGSTSHYSAAHAACPVVLVPAEA